MQLLEKEILARREESIVRRLRDRKGVSQRTLSERTGISRGRLRRLEGEGFEKVTYAEIKRIARVLGVEAARIVGFEDALASTPSVGRAGETTFQFEADSKGYKLAAFFPPHEGVFIGKLFVLPKRQLGGLETPRAGTIFLQMLLGTLRLEIEGEAYEIREGDHLRFRGDLPYTLENPLLRDSVAFLLTLPDKVPFGGADIL